MVEKARRIALEVAALHAEDVDQKARFPVETMDALRKERMLSAFIPRELGGLGCSFTELHQICYQLGQRCAASAMVFAMHQIQVGCLVRHGMTSAPLRSYLSEVSEKQLLLASATSEVGIGGDTRTSSCAVLREGEQFTLEKNAPVISYGNYADGILVTARRAPTAPASDQVLVLVRKPDFTLEATGTWDTLGMRGTCSLGFVLKASGPTENILPLPYADISAQTMLPFSHGVWASLWLGIGNEAVNRARAFVRGEARKKPGTVPPSALRLAEVVNLLQLMRANITESVREYEAKMGDPEALSALGFAIRMNNLKVGSSQLLVQIVSAALTICGMAGYKQDSKFTVGRHLRDAYGASLMIANERILTGNASLLLVHKEE